MRNYAKKRKFRRLLTITVLACVATYCLVVYFKKYKSDDVNLVKINKERISKEDISKKISEVFSSNNSDINIPEIETLPQGVIETFAKEIYLEKELIKRAKKSGVSSDLEVKNKIKETKNRILIDAYLQKEIAQNVDDEKVKQKYLDLTGNVQGKKEYSISHIVVASQDEANKIYKAYNETSPAKKSQKFAELAKKYSIDKQSANQGGKLGYVLEDGVTKEIAEAMVKLTKSQYTKPIQSEFGWHIVKVEDIRQAKILPFEEVSESIKQQMIKETTDKIYQEIFGDAKIKFLLEKKAVKEEKKIEEKESQKTEPVQSKAPQSEEIVIDENMVEPQN